MAYTVGDTSTHNSTRYSWGKNPGPEKGNRAIPMFMFNVIDRHNRGVREGVPLSDQYTRIATLINKLE